MNEKALSIMSCRGVGKQLFMYREIIDKCSVINFLIGDSNTGKTYKILYAAICYSIERNKDLGIMVRYEKDVESIIDYLKIIWVDISFNRKNRRYIEIYINDRLIGYVFSLSCCLHHKGCFGIDLLIYESCDLGKNTRFLKNETDMFLNLCEEKFSGKIPKIICICNYISKDNPIYKLKNSTNKHEFKNFNII